MEIQVNGKALNLETDATVQTLLEKLDMSTGRVAVEINAEIVPRSTHASHKLQHGDAVEIVHAIGGG